MKGWIRKWSVPASSGGLWTVSLKHDGSYGCSCPAWKFARAPKPDCHHIAFIKANPSYGALSPKQIVLANVCEVTLGEDNVLLTPLVPLGDLHFSLTVACDLARLGASPENVAKYLHGNRLPSAQAYIAEHGRKIYGPLKQESHGHEGYLIIREKRAIPD
ncbi:MAG TPA: hypothetical protein VFR24_04615 [Candidatus Angelobacter sp.]|nr:hypothetical protein [Candidatus Angelobacter sp.]